MATAEKLGYTPEAEEFQYEPTLEELANDIVDNINAKHGIDSQAALRGHQGHKLDQYANDLSTAFQKAVGTNDFGDHGRELSALTAKAILNQYRTGWTPENAAEITAPDEPTKFEQRAEREIRPALFGNGSLQRILKAAAHYGLDHPDGWTEPPPDPEIRLVADINAKYGIQADDKYNGPMGYRGLNHEAAAEYAKDLTTAFQAEFGHLPPEEPNLMRAARRATEYITSDARTGDWDDLYPEPGDKNPDRTRLNAAINGLVQYALIHNDDQLLKGALDRQAYWGGDEPTPAADFQDGGMTHATNAGDAHKLAEAAAGYQSNPDWLNELGYRAMVEYAVNPTTERYASELDAILVHCHPESAQAQVAQAEKELRELSIQFCVDQAMPGGADFPQIDPDGAAFSGNSRIGRCFEALQQTRFSLTWQDLEIEIRHPADYYGGVGPFDEWQQAEQLLANIQDQQLKEFALLWRQTQLYQYDEDEDEATNDFNDYAHTVSNASRFLKMAQRIAAADQYTSQD